MEVREEAADGATVLALSGRLDQKGAREFERRSGDRVAGGARRMLIDVAGVSSIDSAGMRALLALGRRLEALDGMLVLCAPGDALQAAFEVSGFTFTSAATREQALALLRTASAPSRVSGLMARLLGASSQRNVRTRAERPEAAAVAALAVRLLDMGRHGSGVRRRNG